MSKLSSLVTIRPIPFQEEEQRIKWWFADLFFVVFVCVETVPGVGYSRNASCALNLIYTFLLQSTNATRKDGCSLHLKEIRHCPQFRTQPFLLQL